MSLAELVVVNTDEEARRLRFPGSPTLRVDGRDLFPAGEREDWQLGCGSTRRPRALKARRLPRCSGKR